MGLSLFVSVRWHEGRYHGAGLWPPAPARFFQALVAASAQGLHLLGESRGALRWLEELDPPLIAAPRARSGQRLTNYVPNNDLDSVGGDPNRVSEIRTDKSSRPYLFDESVPLSYAWSIVDSAENRRQAEVICRLASQLYQLGRGVDQAWAWGELLMQPEAEQRLASHPGCLHKPGAGSLGLTLPSPAPGSLASLQTRFEAQVRRFEVIGEGSERQTVLRQAPPARFAPIVYDGVSNRQVFQLFQGRLAAWPLRKASMLVDWVRSAAAARLGRAFPDKLSIIERIFWGKGSRSEADKAERLRILPLASIGHDHVDLSVRRVLVEVPGDCPLSARDVFWAFSGLDVVNPETGEVLGPQLVPADEDDRMLGHYGTDVGHQVWHSITPLALPEGCARRRIEPTRQRAESKSGKERVSEESRAGAAVVQALRHAGCDIPVDQIQVQREPFLRKGERAERFAEGTRFPKERLWHVRLQFRRPVAGPLVLGDGRFLGLGVMAPVTEARPVIAYEIVSGLTGVAEPGRVALALRRAVMARVQSLLGEVPAYFSGHLRDGQPVLDDHGHLAFAAQLPFRLFVFAPQASASRFAQLARALEGFDDLRAGECGRLRLRPLYVADQDPIMGSFRRWESVTAYEPTRHPKKHDSLEDFLSRDLLGELARRGLPAPLEVEVLSHEIGPRRGGMRARLRVVFGAAVSGPIYLGRSSHKGGGLFAGVLD
jgi:CRISPR-associated protein Csb2